MAMKGRVAAISVAPVETDPLAPVARVMIAVRGAMRRAVRIGDRAVISDLARVDPADLVVREALVAPVVRAEEV